MEKKFGKGSEEFTMFTDYWNFVQKYYIPEQNDEWWEEFLVAADDLINKYGKGQYIRDLTSAHIRRVELTAKQL